MANLVVRLSNGIIQFKLPFSFAFGIGPMTGEKVAWFKWERYIWIKKTDLFWQIRFLWFYFGRLKCN